MFESQIRVRIGHGRFSQRASLSLSRLIRITMSNFHLVFDCLLHCTKYVTSSLTAKQVS